MHIFKVIVAVSSLPTNMGNMSLNAASCVTTPPSSAADGLLELPSYSQCVPDSYGPDEGDGGIIDENERISLQEAEDERLARAMMQQDDEEVHWWWRVYDEEGLSFCTTFFLFRFFHTE